MMNDLISRRAAIDALDGEIEITGRTNAEAVKGYVRLVRDRLEQLPSAQPDTGSLEQIKWERDIAIQQLKDLGYSLGEKIRTDGDTISRQALMKEFSDFVRASNNSDFAPTPTWNDAVSLVGSMPSAQSTMGQQNDGDTINRLERCKFEYLNACKIVAHPTKDTSKSDIYDAHALIKALHPIFGNVEF